MEEIKVGEYVRINKNFRIICIGIGKVVNKNTDTISVEMSNNNLPISFNIDSISKHSKNIIDLIEVGDYVNGYICRYITDIDTGEEHLCNYDLNEMRWVPLEDIDVLENVVTKEQIEAMSYRMED